MPNDFSRAAAAYGSTGKVVVDQRALEANALMKAARAFEEIRREWNSESGDLLREVLLYNRKLWTVFAAEAANEDNPLPLEIRNNIANISIFVFKRTIELQAAPSPEKLEALIGINKNVAAGLLTPSQVPTSAADGTESEPLPPAA